MLVYHVVQKEMGWEERRGAVEYMYYHTDEVKLTRRQVPVQCWWQMGWVEVHHHMVHWWVHWWVLN